VKTVAIMQARTVSTRLQGKALLPVAGYPSAVLAALRAGNQENQILVATSSDSSDDALAEQFGSHGIRVFRGPLHDVLERYYLAADDLANDCVVVRLTGDNVVPDGCFVQELAAARAASGVEYLVGEFSAGSPSLRFRGGGLFGRGATEGA
jgi:spore coat polysaccharide biosynthesis protein SpsF (cytidylyltransferase family)